MKKRLFLTALLLLLTAVSAFALADVEINADNFPDPVFIVYVKKFDSNSDGRLSDDEIANALQINVPREGITNLKGIEYFTALWYLNCSDNALGSLDVSGNTALETLYCYNCNLTTLRFDTKKAALQELSCYGNLLTKLDVRPLYALRQLDCETNALTEILLPNETGHLTELRAGGNRLKSLDLRAYTALESVYLDKPQTPIAPYAVIDGASYYGIGTYLGDSDFGSYVYDGLSGVLKCPDGSQAPGFTRPTGYKDVRLPICVERGEEQRLPVTADFFPDEGFRKVIINQIDSSPPNRNGMLDDEEIQRVQKIVADRSGITTLEGLGYFPTLLELHCWENHIESLDLSVVPNLTLLSCGRNRLTSLDLSGVPNLTYLDCKENLLSSLDASHVSNLAYLNCSSNRLTRIDLTANADLKYLNCCVNMLSTIDLSGNRALSDLHCGYGVLEELDLRANTELKTVFCGKNRLAKVDLTGLEKLENFDGAYQNITRPYYYEDGKCYCLIGPGLSYVDFDNRIMNYDPLKSAVCFLSHDNIPDKFDYLFPVGIAGGESAEADGGIKPMDVHVTRAPDVAVRSIILEPEELTLGLSQGRGNTAVLSVSVYPVEATYRDVDWRSSDENVATVEEGLVTAVGEGTAVISCRAMDSSGVTASCTVTVGHTHTRLCLMPVPATEKADGQTGKVRCAECRIILAPGITIPKDSVLRLPTNTTAIGGEAFRGAAAMQVNVPKGVKTIGAGALTGAKLVVFEDGDVDIEAGAFGQDTWIICPEDSKVSRYAIKYGKTWFSTEE